MKQKVPILVVVCALLGALAAEAQILTGRILGVVRDESGAALPGTTATLESSALPGGPIAVLTTELGEFRLTELPPGIYQLKVALPGFRSHLETDLRVSAGGTIERTITLAVGPIEQSVTVSGQAPVVDSRRPGVVVGLPVEAVEAIPQNRQGGVVAYLAAMPGVTSANYNRIASAIVMGSNANETSYMSDGILTNSVVSGNGYAYLDQDAIEEISLVTLGASAEYQQAQGGIMNVVTKAGTSRWRGDALYYWAPPALTSAPITLPCNCPQGETGFKLYKYVDFGIHAGGPLVKDRAWYFGGVSDAGPSARFPGAPDTPEDYRWTRDEYRSNHKLTWKINSRINFSQVFYYEWWHWSIPDFPTTLNPLETLTWYTGDIRAGASALTATLSPSTVLAARYTVYHTPLGDVGFGPGFAKNDLQTPARVDVFTGATSSNAFADAYQPRRDEVAVKVNRYFSGSRVDHNLRAGVQLTRGRVDRQDVWPGGVQYRDYNGAPLEAVFIPPSTDAMQSTAQGVWVEDEMTVGSLTVVPAVRVDQMRSSSPPARIVNPTSAKLDGGLCRCVISFPFTGEEVAGLGSLFTWTAVSPRLGVTVKLTDDGKTLLKTTVGRYHRPIFLNEFAGIHPGMASSTLASSGHRRLHHHRLRDGSARQHRDRSRHRRALYRSILGRGRSRAEEAPGRQRHLRAQGLEAADRLDRRWRRLRRTVGDGARWPGHHGVPAARRRERSPFPAHQWSRVLQPVQRADPGTDALIRRPMDGARRLQLLDGRGLQSAGTTGRDPNDLINLTGRLDGNDRPHILNVSGTFEVPKIEVRVSGNLTLTSGRPYGAQFQVRLPQGLRNVFFEPPGSYRRPDQQWLHLRVSRILFRNGPRYVELGGASA